MSLVNSAGTAVVGNAVTAGSTLFLKATVRDATGAPVTNKLVTFTSAGGVVAFTPASGQVLTDPVTGVATVQVAPANVNSAGADTVTASTTVGTTPVSVSLDVQTSPANVSLSAFSAAQTSLTAFQNTTVSVNAAVNGQPATTTPVSVAFSASCGSFSPATASSDSTGKVTTTFLANGCTGGSATLTASAQGATPQQTTVTVQAPQPTNLTFVSATPSVLFTSAASSGDKQSTVVFQVVDASGNPITASTQVQVSLSAAAIAAGVVFADTNTTTPEIVPTNAAGQVSVLVKSGGFPTPVSLDAFVVSNPLISASSSGLTVNSGRPVQKFFSPSVTTANIEGWRVDGATTTITVRVADRLGQPIPAGTPISFVAEGGQVAGSCSVTLDGENHSGCSVSLQSQEFRPLNGRVTVLAFMDGDEGFQDNNGNNRFDAGEPFADQGRPFLDFDEDGSFTIGEQPVGVATAPGIGIQPCPAQVANIANTCDGVWGPTRVRGQVVIVFSDSFAIPKSNTFDPFTDLSSTGVTVFLKDLNGNPLPAGTTVTATVAGGTNCSVQDVIPATVPSTVAPTLHRVIVSKGGGAADTCTGAEVSVKATTPRGNVTLLGSVRIP
jgi:hypothetical protein